MQLQIIDKPDTPERRLWKFELTDGEVCQLFVSWMCARAKISGIPSDIVFNALLSYSEKEASEYIKTILHQFRAQEPFFAAIIDERRRLGGIANLTN